MSYDQTIIPRSKAHPTPECPTVHRDFITPVIRGIITACDQGKETILVKNPCVEFVRQAKAGTYDSISDSDYNSLLADVEWVSTNLWRGQVRETYETLFYNLKHLSPLSPMDVTRISYVIRHSLKENKAASYSEDSMPDLNYSLFIEEEDSNPGSVYYEDNPLPEEIAEPASDLTPHQICDQLSQSIYGQEDAKKAASMLLWNHLHGRKRNLLFAGPTGCGKTALFQALKKIYPYIIIVDGTKITKDGWKGNFKISNIFDTLTPSDAQRSIVVLDEADKFFEPMTDSENENVSYQIQSELLKLIEGTELTRNDHQIVDTSHVSFVFLGSFQLMQKKKIKAAEEALKNRYLSDAETILSHDAITTQDLVSFAGVRQEVAGRIDGIIQMQPMEAEDFRTILNTESMSPLSELEKQYGIQINISERQERQLCRQAADSHLGVRYLRSTLQCQLDNQLFDHPDNKEYLLFADA